MDERINILRKYNLWGDTAFDFGFRRSEYNEKIMDFIQKIRFVPAVREKTFENPYRSA